MQPAALPLDDAQAIEARLARARKENAMVSMAYLVNLRDRMYLAAMQATDADVIRKAMDSLKTMAGAAWSPEQERQGDLPVFNFTFVNNTLNAQVAPAPSPAAHVIDANAAGVTDAQPREAAVDAATPLGAAGVFAPAYTPLPDLNPDDLPASMDDLDALAGDA
jgi:hypothetical protein